MLGCSMLMLGRPFWAVRRTWGTSCRICPLLQTHSPQQRRHFGIGRLQSVQDFFEQKGRGGDTNNDDQETIVTFITDVEGDKAYLDRYVETSKVLEFVDTTTNTLPTGTICHDASVLPYTKCINFTHPRALLVFGGDVWDKGGHDLYTIRQLLDLKRRYPDRVLFILGNRDVNKLRILQELGFHDPPPSHPGLMWFKGTGKLGDPDSNPPPLDSVERLRWMLANTMGSPDAFDLRKQELQWERSLLLHQHAKLTSTSRTAIVPVTDQDVVESYRKSCHPQGELGQFLSQAQLICRLGPLLFVHGSLPLIDKVVLKKYQHGQSIWDDLTFCMPWLAVGETAQKHGVETIDQWITALNDFCQNCVEHWKQDIARIEAMGGKDDSPEPMWACRGGYNYGPKYSALIQYGMGMLPGGKKNPSVVYNSFTPAGMPHRFYPDSEEPHMVQATKEFFDRASIQVILAGHKPQGDMPSPIRVDESSWVLLGDTSYSSQTIWHHHGDHSNNNNDSDNKDRTSRKRRSNLGRGNSLSFRGEIAVSEILIKLKGRALDSVIYHGVMSDGSEYETINLLAQGKNTTLGQVAPEDVVPSIPDSPHQGRWWTKSVFSDGSHLYHAGEGFNIWNLMSDPPNSRFGSSST